MFGGLVHKEVSGQPPLSARAMMRMLVVLHRPAARPGPQRLRQRQPFGITPPPVSSDTLRTRTARVPRGEHTQKKLSNTQ